MKKTWIKILTVGITGVFLTGCGSTIPEMTEEQQELVVEYAAGEILKYDRNHVASLVALEVDQEEESEETDSSPAVGQDDPVSDDEEEKGGVTADEVTVIDQTEEIQPASVDEFMKLDEVKISYTGYELAESYPEETADEAFFFMSATENHKLLVLKFQVENQSVAEKELDLAQSQIRYKIVVDGEQQNALTTMLLNDMEYYQGTLAPQESVELVLVGEVPAEMADQISSLELIMKSVDETATISLN